MPVQIGRDGFVFPSGPDAGAQLINHDPAGVTFGSMMADTHQHPPVPGLADHASAAAEIVSGLAPSDPVHSAQMLGADPYTHFHLL